MWFLTDKDEKILCDYLNSYKECFEAMNELLCEVIERVDLTEKEKELARQTAAKYKNMLYHLRKWNPIFRKM